MVSDQLPPGKAGQCLAPVPTLQVTALPAGTGCPPLPPALHQERGTGIKPVSRLPAQQRRFEQR